MNAKQENSRKYIGLILCSRDTAWACRFEDHWIVGNRMMGTLEHRDFLQGVLEVSARGNTCVVIEDIDVAPKKPASRKTFALLNEVLKMCKELKLEHMIVHRSDWTRSVEIDTCVSRTGLETVTETEKNAICLCMYAEKTWG
uniref:Uncharacterized protein n=1 Tax=viral metagenome TaxID=1070528 RepID=A0A6M3IVV6_9ZZZZ